MQMQRFKKRKSALGIPRIVVINLFCFIICQNTKTAIVAFDINNKLKPGQTESLLIVMDFEQQFSIEILDKKAYLLC
jgi:hypothetical protein